MRHGQKIRRMDSSEKAAKEYLEHLGLGAVTFEPDGNVCPDFLLDGRIAVEVRRLNQNESADSGFRGLEQTSRPLLSLVNGVLHSLGPGRSGESWFISYTFKRPLPPYPKLRSDLHRALEPYLDNPRNKKGTTIRVGNSLKVTLVLRADKAYPTFFLVGSWSDPDSGGWVLAETKRNLEICINDKTPEMERVRYKYPEWWLVLLDKIGYGVNECEIQIYKEHLRVQHSWDKVIIVNPLNPKCAFEIPRAA